ncbi:uncharacterized protein LOC143171337 [Aptenodytes patagonicus]|uniref:uncharacterized protein LOC143171337 n=1 Tax=Aptenodytes patagonicus TaxID=9234 RepID=UPI003FA05971
MLSSELRAAHKRSRHLNRLGEARGAARAPRAAAATEPTRLFLPEKRLPAGRTRAFRFNPVKGLRTGNKFKTTRALPARCVRPGCPAGLAVSPVPRVPPPPRCPQQFCAAALRGRPARQTGRGGQRDGHTRFRGGPAGPDTPPATGRPSSEPPAGPALAPFLRRCVRLLLSPVRLLARLGLRDSFCTKVFPYLTAKVAPICNRCRLTCTDPNPNFRKFLLESLSENQHLKLEHLVVASGEDLHQIPDGAVDAVVCALVLCSVTNIKKVLTEVLRVLRLVNWGSAREIGDAVFVSWVELSTSWSTWLQIIPVGPTFGKRSVTQSGSILEMDVP